MELLGWILISLSGFLLSLYLYLSHKFSYWSDKNVKVIQPNLLSIFGNLSDVGTKVHYIEKLQEIYNKFIKEKSLYCGIYFMTTPKLLALDLNFIKEIMDNDFDHFNSCGLFANEKSDRISNNVCNLDGEKWKCFRSKLAPIFTKEKMKVMLESVLFIGDDLKNLIEQSAKERSPINIKDICLRFTTDILGAYSVGNSSSALKKSDSTLKSTMKKAFCYNTTLKVYKYIFQNSYNNLAKLLGIQEFESGIEPFFHCLVQKSIQYRQKSAPKEKPDFLQLLLQIKDGGMIDDDNSAQFLGTFTPEDLTAQVFMLFYAGLDTISTTMSFCLYELSLNQKIQDKLRNEINLNLAKTNGKLTYDSLIEMEYLTQVINETLRKYSPVHTIYRKSNQRYTVPGTDSSIDEGTQVIIPVYAIHNDGNIYKNPEEFDPDRFLPENVEKRHPYSFLGFSSGPRKCLGQEFGLVNLKMGLCSILSNYTFSVNLKTETPIKFNPTNILLEAKNGIWLNVERL